MQLSSPAFDQNEWIPRKFSGEGDDASPALEWRNVPKGTQSFVVFCEDPDAPSGTFHHWAVWDIPAEWRRLNEGLPNQGGEVHQAINDFGRRGYGGPLPPRGHGAHRYSFKVAALNCDHLPVGEGAKVDEVIRAARAFIIDEAELVGRYER